MGARSNKGLFRNSFKIKIIFYRIIKRKLAKKHRLSKRLKMILRQAKSLIKFWRKLNMLKLIQMSIKDFQRIWLTFRNSTKLMNQKLRKKRQKGDKFQDSSKKNKLRIWWNLKNLKKTKRYKFQRLLLSKIIRATRKILTNTFSIN